MVRVPVVGNERERSRTVVPPMSGLIPMTRPVCVASVSLNLKMSQAAMSPAAFPELPISALREHLTSALLHVGRSIPPPGFVQFWTRWRRPVFEGSPELVEIGSVKDAGDAAARFGLTHVLRAADGVRLGARLMLPEGAAKGFVIATHGYAVGDDEKIAGRNPWAKHGLGVLALRVRGFPGSCFDVPNWSRAKEGWIAQGIDDASKWSLPAAVGDVISGFRALRGRFGEGTPIALHGESFGGALAIFAASQLSGRAEVSRMALGVPTMGDWAWRLEHNTGLGLEADVRAALAGDEERAKAIHGNLRLFDTVVHARRVVCPVVMKMAAQDPVVPPPTVGAIYNALGSAPGTKWRFIVQHGHTPNPPIDDLRRHALFERLATQFVCPDWSLEGMGAWEGVMGGGERV